MFSSTLLSGILLVAATPAATLSAAEPDTLRTAVVSAERGVSVSRADTLRAEAAVSLTDLLLRSPGLVVADYGGATGIKSVNLRGLGSPHTSIYIDGVRAGNVQSGQVDLSLLGLENFGGAVVDYAQNSVSFETSRPKIADATAGERVAGNLSLGAGSFGTWQPRGRLDWRLSDGLCLSANAATLFSRGDFPYMSGSGPTAGEARRANNDSRQVRGGLDLFGRATSGDWHVKAFVSDSERGTAGSVDWPSTDRQRDRNAYLQGLAKLQLAPRYSLTVSGKASRDDVVYLSQWGDSDYAQTEFQTNTAQRFLPFGWLDLSLVAELQRDLLSSSVYSAARTDIVAIAGAALKFPRLRADLTLQYEGIFDGTGSNGYSALRDLASINVVSPSADFRFAAAEGLDLVGFARRAFRAPTFNELYYPGFGNPFLRPEDAWLTDLGADWQSSTGGPWSFRAKLDAFYNYLTDKIVSAPSTADPSIWLPYNIGQVRAKGIDADAALGFVSGEWKASASARYSLQIAKDVPFLSKHTVVLSADASFRGWTADLLWNLRAGRLDASGPMPDWRTLDLSLSRSFPFATVCLVCRNLADYRYELVPGYPMPGRNFLISLNSSF